MMLATCTVLAPNSKTDWYAAHGNEQVLYISSAGAHAALQRQMVWTGGGFAATTLYSQAWQIQLQPLALGSAV